MTADSFRLALVQFCASQTPADNMATVRRLAREAVDQGAQVVMTPEMTNIIAPRRVIDERVGTQTDDDSVGECARIARELGVYFLAGSLALKDVGERLVNRSLLFSPAGELMASYDKIHMFDVDLDGGESYRESRNYQPGSAAVVANLPWLKLGMTVCYDMRFGALYRQIAKAGAGLISVPSAFTRPTGKAHWEVLLRARAIENGCFVAAAAQTGEHESGRKTYGHSMIVSPWGEVLAEAGDEECVLVHHIDIGQIEETRGKVPSLQHDRSFRPPQVPPVYEVAS